MTSKRIHIPHYVIVKSPGLLLMLYKVAELANELKIPERTLRGWLELGAPFVRDSRKRIWINGQDFSFWVVGQRKAKRDRKLTDSQGYCLRCNEIVEIVNPETFHIKGKLTNTRGACPICGGVVNRGGRIPNMPTRSLLANNSTMQQEI
jgi:hypothetical protein